MQTNTEGRMSTHERYTWFNMNLQQLKFRAGGIDVRSEHSLRVLRNARRQIQAQGWQRQEVCSREAAECLGTLRRARQISAGLRRHVTCEAQQ